MTSKLTPVTNIAYIPLKPGTDIKDSLTLEGKAWKEAQNIIRSQYGYQQSYQGEQLESPDTMTWLIGVY
jgi:hypothetical protein